MSRNTRETPSEAMARLRARVRIESAEVAIDALVGVCRDPKSPAQARAAAGSALLRAAGFFSAGDEPVEKELYEMSPEELEREIRRLTRLASEIEDKHRNRKGVFG